MKMEIHDECHTILCGACLPPMFPRRGSGLWLYARMAEISDGKQNHRELLSGSRWFFVDSDYRNCRAQRCIFFIQNKQLYRR